MTTCVFSDAAGCYAPAAHGDHTSCDCACHVRIYDFRCKQCGAETDLRSCVEPETIVCHDCGTGKEIAWWRKRPVVKVECVERTTGPRAR